MRWKGEGAKQKEPWLFSITVSIFLHTIPGLAFVSPLACEIKFGPSDAFITNFLDSLTNDL